MRKELKQFIINVLFLYIIIILASQLLFSSIFETYDFPGRILSVSFIWIVTCVFHYWIIGTVVKAPKTFARVFIMQTGFRLLLYLACILIYLLFYRQHAVAFLANFLIAYLLFAIFEMVSTMRFVQKNNTRSNGQ